ncbi:MAG TPA: dTDP-4-dehydrorhamnose reductase [Gemmatimonadales bacterium]|nr:dTDP-4-dehydrorhamnose reductase [Gemmatimonadales bacterium]
MSASAPVHLVIGANGQVGFELVQQLAGIGRIIGLARPEVNLENLKTVRDAIRLHRPSVIWNAAAATAVDMLEESPWLGEQVNAKAPGVMAEEAKRTGAVLVQFSTDYVFDGTKTEPYTESDRTNPLNVYGRTKLAGEKAVEDSGARYLILRTSWVYSSRGRNFVRAILDRARESNDLRVVCDQVGAPTWSREIARACARIAPRLDETAGILHLTAGGSCTWFDFAIALQGEAIRRALPWRAGLEPVTTEEYGARARRPLNSVLSNEALRARLGEALPDWGESHAQFWRTDFTEKEVP